MNTKTRSLVVRMIGTKRARLLRGLERGQHSQVNCGQRSDHLVNEQRKNNMILDLEKSRNVQGVRRLRRPEKTTR